MVNQKGFEQKPVNQGSSSVAAPQAQNSKPMGTGFQSGTKQKVDPMQKKPQKVGSKSMK